MGPKNATRNRIIRIACELFIKQGYDKTTIRQIAREAQVGVGLIGYHFQSKENIAVAMYEYLYASVEEFVDRYVSKEDDPYTHMAALIYLLFAVNTCDAYRKLYCECLENGIFEKAIVSSDTNIQDRIMCIENKQIPHDLLLLYGTFVPVGVEKALVLNKQKGLFENISYEQIPEIIFDSSIGKYSTDREAQQRALASAKSLVESFGPVADIFSLDRYFGSDGSNYP